ncbi:GntR family transcriptional regulator [Microbacterium sp. LRZ72]|uniref:GntR family transcriptional regulator n=1 Tax=Microbacterium sp. LRZ72 TaxID=2942481 RepID=UPI0029ACD05D|nr:GntR family transcriptional regulator [Microbacterium sp. LRZ72]MDX2377413.1 GntR family transcriptional regulator [Microbacterium sp. LRZ72]
MTHPLLTLTSVPDGDEALHERIAEQIRRRIDAGVWGRGQQLKREIELADDLHVARGTLRRALRSLVESGHLVQRHGVGTFIAGEPSHVTAFESLGERLERGGIRFETTELAREIASAGDWGAGAEAGPALVLRRLRTAEGAPVSLLLNAVSLRAAPGLTETDLSGRSLYATLADDFGVVIERSDLIFTAVPADHGTAHLLAVDAGSPLTHMSQISYTQRGEVVDVASAWIRPDRHQPGVTLWGGRS